MHSQPAHWRGRLGYIILGLASLAWLGLRSGARPSRLVYPCQQVAASGGLGFLTYIVALISSMRAYRYARRYLTLGRIGLLTLGLTLVVLLRGEMPTFSAPAQDSLDLPAWVSPDAISDVFAVTNVPRPMVSLDGGIIPQGVSPAEALHDDGVDVLVNLMTAHGTYFYRTAQQPGGIVGPNDVVVIKVNNQWNCSLSSDNRRSHTNTDAVADLNIVDAIWVNPADQGGYASEAVRDNILLASTDPFAVDYYASAYVLVPHMTPGSGWANKADARYHGGEFRRLLMTNENRARLRGMTAMIDLDDNLTADEEQAQFNVFVADASAPL